MRRPTRRETGLAGFLLGTPVSVPSVAAGVVVAGVLFALLLAGVVVGERDRSGFELPGDRNS